METALPPDPPSAADATRRSVALPLLAAVLVMLAVAIVPSAPSELNVDADISSGVVLDYAHQHGLQFGTDLVYLYGPFGYLIYFYFTPNAVGTRLVVDAALCFTVAAGLCVVGWRLRLGRRCLLLGLFLLLAANADPRTDLNGP